MAASLAVALSVSTPVLGAPGAEAAQAPGPPPSSFYVAPAHLAATAPGDILRTRVLSVGSAEDLSVTQVLYRTTGQLGHPTVTAATVITSKLAPRPTAVLSYQEAYDGLGPQCQPSYRLSSGLGALSQVTSYLATGLVLVVPDYEGIHQEWTAGQEAGYETLDGIRAAEALLHLPLRTTKVGLVGYSGGAIATDYATELAPRYAPGLDIAGAAEGGVAANFAHVLKYVNGSAYWSGVIPMALVGLGRAFHIPLARYLSAYGTALTSAIAKDCLGSVAGHYPGLTYQRLFKPAYQDIFAVPVFKRIFGEMVMGRSGTPRAPLFIGEGLSDGTGDGVMVASDVQALARTYCQRGVTVQFHLYKGLDHNQAVAPFVAGALAFLAKALFGLPLANGCAAIPPTGATTS
jgi:hypothetical protein